MFKPAWCKAKKPSSLVALWRVKYEILMSATVPPSSVSSFSSFQLNMTKRHNGDLFTVGIPRTMRKQWKKSNLHMPCALIERGDPVKYYYAESVKDYTLERHNGTCIGANRQAKKCDCLCKVDGTFLSCLEEYVDITWRHQTLHGKLEIAKNTVCVDGTGIKGKFLVPFDVGAIFHPLCTSSWSRLLGCSTKHLKVFCQVLSGRRTVSSVSANVSPPVPPIISDGDQRMKEGAEEKLAASVASSRTNASTMESSPTATDTNGGGGNARDEDKDAERAASIGRLTRQNAPMSNLLEIIQMLKSDDESSDGDVLV